MSAPKPAAPLGSLALKTNTQGGLPSSGAWFGESVSGGVFGFVIGLHAVAQGAEGGFQPFSLYTMFAF